MFLRLPVEEVVDFLANSDVGFKEDSPMLGVVSFVVALFCSESISNHVGILFSVCLGSFFFVAAAAAYIVAIDISEAATWFEMLSP